MSFYLRKALRVGPFRFNLSKSGIGVSTGIRGMRLGTGPRGNYVHMGREGIYYRKMLPPVGSASPSASPAATPEALPQPSEPQDIPPAPDTDTTGEFKEIDSVATSQMTSASAAGLLEEINEKRKKARIAPAVGAIELVILLMSPALNVPAWAFGLLLVAFIALFVWVVWKDQVRKSVVVLYDFDPDLEKAYQGLHDAFGNLAACKRVKHVEASADVKDKKYHAGADSVVKATAVRLKAGEMPFLKTNVSTPLVPAGRQTLAFLPDRLLVFEPGVVGAVEYSDLKFDISTVHFIEEDGVPDDAKVVGQTWKYVNKKGGPDKRFRDNREIPIAEYERIRFHSDTGLNEMIQLSKLGVAEPFESVIRQLAKGGRG